MNPDTTGVEPIAIIGMACRVPGADSLDQFWRNMRDGVESITWFTGDQLVRAGVDPQAVADPDYVPAAGVIADADRFDAGFFGYNAREAETLDPQQRVLCEVAWAALEDSGYVPDRLPGTVGVFAGTFMNKYMSTNLQTNPKFLASPMAPYARTFNDKDFLATRLAYLFNLDGPAMTIQTACSTSLVATHVACQSLLSYECDVAIVGGVTINIPLMHGYPGVAGGLFSEDGHCRPFDKDAGGTVPGNGAVVVVLRRLADALADSDQIHAVIRGTAVNNDGSVKAGFTAPSANGQARAIGAAQAMAGIDAASIQYVETHGTATAIGDPIEVAALTTAFRASTSETGFCALGSVKANIGHLDAAAGLAGLMRAALALSHEQIPVQANVSTPNPDLKLGSSPFYLPMSTTEWRRGQVPRRAGVSSFGVGGTNAHAVLEQAPARPRPVSAKPWQLVPISARSRAAVDAATARLAAHLEEHPQAGIGDLAYTLQSGRQHFPVRRFVTCTDRDDLLSVLRGGEPHRILTKQSAGTTPGVVFMFPGAGTQHRSMGSELYQTEPVFRAEIDRCAESLLAQASLDLRTVLFQRSKRSALGRADGPIVGCALFAVEYALAKLWMSWGVNPVALVGHSLGEYVAASLASVFSVDDAMRITFARGELLADMPPGRMVAVQASAAVISRYLNDRLSISAFNAPELTVVAGPDDAIESFVDALRADDIECSRMNVPVASHSWMVEPYLDEFVRAIKECNLNPPQLPVLSAVTGQTLSPVEAMDAGHWARHLRQPVRFADALTAALAEPNRLLLEVGPGRALSALASMQRIAPVPVAVPSLGHARDRQPELSHLMHAVGQLWQSGADIDWRALHGTDDPRRISLPTYPFERTLHWIAPGHVRLDPAVAELPSEVEEDAEEDDCAAPTNDRERELVRIWSDLLGVERIGIHDDLFAAGAHSLMITQVTRELHKRGVKHISARDVLQAPTIATLAALIDGGVRQEEIDLAAEVTLEAGITAAGLPPVEDRPLRTVLLTGGTGFVGSFLCAELGARTEAEVVCLVRAASAEEGTDRLLAALASYGLAAPRRLTVVPGDLEKPRLGLSEETFTALAQRVDAIYHCGAWVNFVRPYRSLKAANVGGTVEVLRLATHTRLKPVHHISTMAVLAGAIMAGAGEILEDDPLPPPEGHDTAYSQSKWVAEGVLAIARERGIPVSIYRAGAVMCDSRTGAANSEDYLTKVIQGCVELGMAPRRHYPLAAASVDYVARSVVAQSLSHQGPATFHVINPQPLAWNDIFEAACRHGFGMRMVPFDTWRQELIEQVELDDSANALAPLLAMLGDTADRPMPRMDCRNTAPLADTAPALDGAYFERMLRFFVRGGWLPAVD